MLTRTQEVDSTYWNTGWSKKTVNCNFFVTGVKFTKDGKTQSFLEMVHWEILIFWCLKSVRWKTSCLSRFCQNGGLAPDWVNLTWRKESPVVCQCLLASVCAWCSLVNELGICGNILGFIHMFQWVLDAQWCSGVCLRAHSMRDPVWLKTNQPIWHNIERRDCFILTLSRHQNIKTSLNIISKNGWVLPFSLILTPVRKKLQLTVLLDHPVYQN